MNMKNENKVILTGKCQGCTHKSYDNSFNLLCLGCKRQWYPSTEYNYYERKPDLYNEDVLIP